MSPTSSETYSTDNPIRDKELDAFQRYPFSKRIAETIAQRKDSLSLVLGIFGAWGEGKSTVLNFIDEELKQKEKILLLRFNPWRYREEDTLIKNFFQKISVLLGKELPSKVEKVTKLFKMYGQVSLLGVDFGKIGKNLADVDLEKLKERVSGFIEESGKRLVILIDDIDRLDKQEIYSLLKLVRLNADFKNTTYVLSFDQEMVSSAIGERFGAGDKKAGENFLEKIIQVPLPIPKAHSESLRRFCSERIENSMRKSAISLSKEEKERFDYQFRTNILIRLRTPRLAIRYSNILSFSLPLLKGEVNIVDLMLIEALRVFYPDHYSFVKNNPDYFTHIDSDFNSEEQFRNSTKVDLIKKHLKQVSLPYNLASF